MQNQYSRSALRWILFPLVSFPTLILLSAIANVINGIPKLSTVLDFLFMIYLLIIICLPVIFALCGIRALIFSFKALRNQEAAGPLIAMLLIACIYLAAGGYHSYYFTYDILFR